MMPSLCEECKEKLLDTPNPWGKRSPPLVISLEVVLVDRRNGEGYGHH
jgi:hypothetical protein